MSFEPLATKLFQWSDQAIILWGAVAAILFLVSVWLGAFRRLTQGIVRRVEARLKTRAPRDTMRIVERPGQLRWNEGSIQRTPATQVSGSWLVTNPMQASKTDLLIARVDLRPPLAKRLRLDRELSDLESFYSANRIPWGGTQEVHALFWLVPRVSKTGRDLRARVVFTDQFGNTKRVRVRFRAPRNLAPTPTLRREDPRDIAEPTEKDVASVLQAELARYKTNGRNEGGFGSVRITYAGREVGGSGDWIEVGTPRNQFIVLDPANAEVESDNMDALLTLFASADLKTFRDALLARVDRSQVYAPIAYLAMLVALQCDFSDVFFAAAKENLLGDSEFGFSNCLMLLDTLLRLKHTEFSNESLSAIEEFIHDIGDESTFSISERIAAIRVLRIREG